MAEMDAKTQNNIIFEMGSLRINLPQKRGLSRFYTGKARSFASMEDVHTLEDLKKQEHHSIPPTPPRLKKRRKQNSDRKIHVASMPCCRVSSTKQFASHILGV